MSYCVKYSPELGKRYPSVVKIRRKFPVGVLFGVLFFVVAAYALISSDVLHYLIPGDPAVTTAAFSLMVEEIGAGESVSEAFFSFCKEIVVNAS